MAKRVLVPIDGSPLSKRALTVAVGDYPDASITALHVIDPSELGYSYYPFDRTADLEEEPPRGSAAWWDRAEELADELEADAERVATEHDATVETDTVVGSPARAILDYATTHDIDHIIIGSHGREEESRLLLGSVTEAVAFRSPVRVTLVR
ncbi:universal stress protein (plasmid) [Haloferacaceae archaeon DSL9]